jgi:hypothetical protein
MMSPKLDEAAIFDAVRRVETPEAQRRFIDEACGADEAMRKRLEVLFRIHHEDRDLLVRPAAGVT